MVLFYKANGKKEIPTSRSIKHDGVGDDTELAVEKRPLDVGNTLSGENGSAPSGSLRSVTGSASAPVSASPSVSGL